MNNHARRQSLDVREVARLLGGTVTGPNSVTAPAPRHGPTDRSMSVKLDPTAPDGFLVHSFGRSNWQECRDHIADILGSPRFQRPASLRADLGIFRHKLAEARAQEPANDPKPFNDDWLLRRGYEQTAVYPYYDRSTPLFDVLRYEHPSEPKEIRPKHFCEGTWFWGCGTALRPLYRAADLDTVAHTTAFVTEGEKDADRLASLGFVAVTVAFHKWTPEAAERLRGWDCYILEDNDDAGRNNALKAAEALDGLAASIRIVRLPNLPKGGDVSDWLDAGGDYNKLVDIAKASPVWEPARESETTASDADEPIFDPWETYIVPSFPFEVLPQVVQRFVTEQSAVIGSDANALAGSVLAAISGALDHRFGLRIMRNGNWVVSPRLWLLLIGPPSAKKTPVINAALEPLEAHQNSVRKAYELRLTEYKKLAKGLDKNDPKPDEPPLPVRYVVSDTTTEKLAEILGRSPRGLLVKRDEFAGLIASMEKYSKGSGADRAFWLKAFDAGPFHVDRINRGELFVENLSVSLIGGIQPARLAELHGLTSDGLLQRFLPIMMKAPAFTLDQPVNSKAAYERLINDLVGAEPSQLILEDDAVAIFEELRRHIHNLEQAADGLAVGFQGFLGKLAGLAGSLALVLHMAEHRQQGRHHAVTAKTAENVRKLVVEFFLPHAFEFYRSAATTTDGDRLRQIASWVVTSGLPRISSRDLTRNVRELRGLSVSEVALRVSPLVAGGWLQPEEPGPANKAWIVLPAVSRQLAARAAEEEARKAAVARLMNSPRASR